MQYNISGNAKVAAAISFASRLYKLNNEQSCIVWNCHFKDHNSTVIQLFRNVHSYIV